MDIIRSFAFIGSIFLLYVMVKMYTSSESQSSTTNADRQQIIQLVFRNEMKSIMLTFKQWNFVASSYINVIIY